jgi:glycosyltransferase involved in cell wall biosynthesis
MLPAAKHPGSDIPTVPPAISIGLPVYNGEVYLRAAIESLLGQSFPDLELVISDNASTDATADICQEYARRDSRVRYVRQPANIGAPGNFNAVFRLARGPYFKWACANDLCHPDLLAECKRILDERADVVLCFSQSQLIDAAGRVLEDYDDQLHLMDPDPAVRFRQLLTRIRLNNAQSGLFRTAVLARSGLERPFQGGDINFMAEMTLYGKFYQLERRLFQRRVSADASTLRKSDAEHRSFNLPESREGWYFPAWQGQLEHFRAVATAPIPLGAKLSLYGFLAKGAYWNRRRLGREMSHMIRGMASSPAASRSE